MVEDQIRISFRVTLSNNIEFANILYEIVTKRNSCSMFIVGNVLSVC